MDKNESSYYKYTGTIYLVRTVSVFAANEQEAHDKLTDVVCNETTEDWIVESLTLTKKEVPLC